MRSQEVRSRPEIEPVPDHLESAQAKLVYVYLEATDGATIEDLRRTLSMKTLSILSILNTLSSAGVVDRRGEEYVTAT